MEPGFGKRVMHVLRSVYHMLRRGLCRNRLMMDLQLLFGRGKLAGKALRNLVAAANHPHGAHIVAAGAGRGAEAASSSSGLSFSHNPRDVEFSCTTTPSYAPGSSHLFPFRIRGRGAGRGSGGRLNVAEVARVFEMMNAEEAGAGAETPSVAGATPSPMLALSLGRSPAGVRQLRVTDSPFPVEPEGVDERVDAEADNFINKFYEQLRLQQAFATPDNSGVRRRA
uniref:Avr9/Cf-9 rapidly elicited protein 146 n=1 Tax=Arundo donax TaxID=35708 RepID=A0A0A9D0W1_ARUDO